MNKYAWPSGIVGDDLVRRHRLPLTVNQGVPAILRMNSVARLDLKLGLHRIAGIATQLGMLIAYGFL
jgi:hypothetical protein